MSEASRVRGVLAVKIHLGAKNLCLHTHLVIAQLGVVPQQQTVRVVAPETVAYAAPRDRVPDHTPDAGQVGLVPPGHGNGGRPSRAGVGANPSERAASEASRVSSEVLCCKFRSSLTFHLT